MCLEGWGWWCFFLGSASSQPFLLGVNSGQGNRLCWFFVLALFSGAGTMHGISLRTLHTLRHFTLNTAQFVGHARQFTLDTTQLVAMHLGHCKICGPCMAIHLGHCTACGNAPWALQNMWAMHGNSPWALHSLWHHAWQCTLDTAHLMAIYLGHCTACGNMHGNSLWALHSLWGCFFGQYACSGVFLGKGIITSNEQCMSPWRAHSL